VTWLYWPRLVGLGGGPPPDLRDRAYEAEPRKVMRAAETALQSTPGWTLAAEGRGVQGAEIQAVHSVAGLGTSGEMTVRIWPEGRRTWVSVRLRNRGSSWTLPLETRAAGAFLSELDRQMAGPAVKQGGVVRIR
jgi:hypothetical protein